MIIREACDACGGPLGDVFSMGAMPLANQLLASDELARPLESYPLTVAECRECSLVQLRYVVEPELLYRDYKFFTGASSPNVAYYTELARWARSRTRGVRALEIGSNDGTLLKCLEDQGLTVTGVDPAVTQCEDARRKLSRGDVRCEYWSEAFANELAETFSLVVACNVVAHSDNLSDFLKGVRRVMNPLGMFVIEVQYLTAMLQRAAFELIYHEHVSYFGEHSLASLLRAHGFHVAGWTVTETQCGTLRMWATLGEHVRSMPNDDERQAPYGAVAHDWTAFRSGIAARRDTLFNRVEQWQRESRPICFYGAPAKATQIANYWRLGSDIVSFATDTTPAKQGRWIPGALIPVVPRDRLTPEHAAIVTAWNYYEQIALREQPFVNDGGILHNPADQE